MEKLPNLSEFSSLIELGIWDWEDGSAGKGDLSLFSRTDGGIKQSRVWSCVPIIPARSLASSPSPLGGQCLRNDTFGGPLASTYMHICVHMYATWHIE